MILRWLERSGLAPLLQRTGMGSRVARNSIFLLAAESLVRVLNLGVTILLYRYLKPEGAGTLRFVISYGIVFGVIADLGLTQVAIREIARNSRESLGRTMAHIALMRTIAAAAMLALIWGSLLVPLNRPIEPSTKLLIVLWSLSIFFQAFRRNSEAVFQGLQRMKYHASFLLLNRLVATILIVSAILAHLGLRSIFIAYLVADLIDAVTSAWFIRFRIQKPAYKIQRAAVAGLVLAAIPFAVHLSAGQIQLYIDSVLLNFLAPMDAAGTRREIGYYQSAYQIVLTMNFIPLSICSALFPALAYAFHHDLAKLRRLFGSTYSLFVLASFPLGLLFFLFRNELIIGLFGRSYAPSVPMLVYVIWALPLIYVTVPLGTLLGAIDLQRYVAYTSVTNAVFNVALNFYLIPKMGGRGAAIATTATMAQAFVMDLYFAAKAQPHAFQWVRLVKMLLFHAIALVLLMAAARAGTLATITGYVLYTAIAAAWALHILRETQQART